MKKLLFIAAAALLIGLSSCKKSNTEPEFCWECQATVTITSTSGSFTMYNPQTGQWESFGGDKTVTTTKGDVYDVCGATQTEINQAKEQAYYSTGNASDGTVGTTSCWKKE